MKKILLVLYGLMFIFSASAQNNELVGFNHTSVPVQIELVVDEDNSNPPSCPTAGHGYHHPSGTAVPAIPANNLPFGTTVFSAPVNCIYTINTAYVWDPISPTHGCTAYSGAPCQILNHPSAPPNTGPSGGNAILEISLGQADINIQWISTY